MGQSYGRDALNANSDSGKKVATDTEIADWLRVSAVAFTIERFVIAPVSIYRWHVRHVRHVIQVPHMPKVRHMPHMAHMPKEHVGPPASTPAGRAHDCRMRRSTRC